MLFGSVVLGTALSSFKHPHQSTLEYAAKDRPKDRKCRLTSV